jgi:erythronate-4-phosphate dehydrogenase
MIKIIADDKIPFLKGIFEPYCSIVYMNGSDMNAAAVKDADALLIRTRTVCNESLLSGSPVKFIATATIGFDHIDTDYCRAHSIRWANAPGCNAASVQQYIASVLANLSINHHFPLNGKTIGIIGVGHVGKKVETLARLLGMKVLLNDPPRARSEGNNGFVTLDNLLNEADIVTLHVPLNSSGTDKTLHFIDDKALGLLNKNSWLINTSRGEVIDSGALKSALSTGRISGAVLDVWENEPIVDRELLDITALATPHIAGYSTDGKRNGTVHMVRTLGKWLDLPLTKWEPLYIPEPADPIITIDCREYLPERLLCHSILHTYDVKEDDMRFRADPGSFEKQRGNYMVRREFPAYRVNLLHSEPQSREILQTLGFRVVEM